MPLNEDARVPCLLIHHIVTHLNYGSVVSNDFDLANLAQSTRAFICNDMFAINEGAEDPIPYDLCGTSIPDFMDYRDRYEVGHVVDNAEYYTA